MKLVIGGYAQGKLQYVLHQYNVNTAMIYDARLPENSSQQGIIIVINHFHDWVRARLLDSGNPAEEIFQFIDQYPDCVIISDEIGNGIVPMDVFERTYREQTGRILVALAARAEEVERVICGIGQKIK